MKLMDVLRETVESVESSLASQSRSNVHRPKARYWFVQFALNFKRLVPSARDMNSTDIIRSFGKDQLLRLYRRGYDPREAAKRAAAHKRVNNWPSSGRASTTQRM